MIFLASDYINIHHIETSFDEGSINSFVILSEIERSIKEKIEKVGTPLKDWDIQINYGIKTGFNEAFIIDGETKDELIAKDPKNGEIIKPLLRGRDIKRYGYEFADKWLICTAPSQNIDIEEYPNIKEYLLTFGYDRLKQTGDKGARKKTNNQWFELQDSISYMDDFSKQKIVWKAVGRNLAFSLAEPNILLVNPSSFLVSPHIIFLLGILNSSYMKYYIYSNSDTTGAGDIMLNIIFLLNCLVPIVKDTEKTNIEDVISEILEIKNNYGNSLISEMKLDNMFYKIFEFTKEEIYFIENQYK